MLHTGLDKTIFTGGRGHFMCLSVIDSSLPVRRHSPKYWWGLRVACANLQGTPQLFEQERSGKRLKARQIFLYYWRLDVAYSREWNELIFYSHAGPVKKMAIPQHGPRHKLTKLAGLISEDNARGWEVTWLADVLLVCSWRQGDHICWKNKFKSIPFVGTKLFFHVNSTKKKIVFSTNMAAS